MKALFSRFRLSATVPYAVLEEVGIVRTSPDKVLRAVVDHRAAQLVLTPADAATSLVLRHGLSVAPSMDVLKVLLSTASEKH